MTKPVKSSALLTGKDIEQQALHWLMNQGLHPLMQNYSCRGGEIDIIMSGVAQLVFVEVRYRRYSTYGSALDSVNKHKQKKLLRTAAHFLASNPHYANWPCRFDVLAAQPAREDRSKLQWLWVKNAFTG